jgi:transmembrane sensor
MASSNKRILYLLQNYMAGTASHSEKEELWDWFGMNEDDGEFQSYIQKLLSEYPAERKEVNVDWERIFAEILAKREEHIEDHLVPAPIYRLNFLRKWGWAAAAAVLLIGSGAFFLLRRTNEKRAIAAVQTKEDVLPGSNKAILTLANGSKIILDSVHNGTLAQQGNTNIVKTDSGQLAYTTSAEKPEKEIALNTLSTPRGGQFQLILPDGTKVWLNAASSITYPTAFVGKERKVTVTGEVYFEVIHNDRQPFSVTANKTEIQDIGTHFNVNAYADESGIKTTLLKGSVRLIENKNKIVLKPGQQGITGIQGDNQIQVTSDIDIEKIMAWKNGWFEFDQTDLSVIMRQISRWYNVDVTFEGNGRGQKFFGRISKDVPLSNILQSLEADSKGVKFKLEGTKLIIQQ